MLFEGIKHVEGTEGMEQRQIRLTKELIKKKERWGSSLKRGQNHNFNGRDAAYSNVDFKKLVDYSRDKFKKQKSGDN